MIKKITAATLCFLVFCMTAVSVAATEQQGVSFPVSGQTWQYLDQNPPGENSILAYSLGQRKIKADAEKVFIDSVDKMIASGYPDPKALGKSVLIFSKLQMDPHNYKKEDLPVKLLSYDNLYKNGLDAAYYAIYAYESLDDNGIISTTSRNSPNIVIDYMISCQQRSGGFALTAGRDSDVRVTARVVAALATEQDAPYVQAALNKALNWLSNQQNNDGTYSSLNQPDCETTAAVLTAISICGIPLDDPRFVKNGIDLLDALNSFQTTDGGYAPTHGASANVEATEQAVIALCTNESGLSPYLHPNRYPGYEKPQPDSKTAFLKFLFGFIAIFAILYGVLILTNKIGKKWGKFPAPTSEQGAGNHEPQEDTMEINIPMKAEVPDFDEPPANEANSNNKK